MRRTAFTGLFVFFAAVGIISMVCLALAGPNIDKDVDSETAAPPPETMNWDAPEEILFDAAHPKIDASLFKLLASRSDDSADPMALSGGMEERVHIQFLAKTADVESAKSMLLSIGGETTGGGAAGFSRDDLEPNVRVVQGWAPILALEKLASHDGVLYVRIPLKALMLREDMNATLPESFDLKTWHNSGFRGSGVKIGVVDSGFSDELDPAMEPPAIAARGFVDGESDDPLGDESSQGGQSARIINEIAPDAEIYTARVDTLVDFQEAVSWLIDDVGVDIIRTSLVRFPYPDESTSSDLRVADDKTFSADVYWATADPANWKKQRFGPFYDRGDGFHLFDAGSNVMLADPPKSVDFAFSNSHIGAFLGWENHIGSSTDLDLFLLRWDGSNWRLVSGSKKLKPDEWNGYSLEPLSTKTSGVETFYGYAVFGRQVQDNLYFDIFTAQEKEIEQTMDSGSAAVTSSQKAGIAALIKSADASLSAAAIQSLLDAGIDAPELLSPILFESHDEIRRVKTGEPYCLTFEFPYGTTYCTNNNEWTDHDEWDWTANADFTAKRLEVHSEVVNSDTYIRILINNDQTIVAEWYAEIGSDEYVVDLTHDIHIGDKIIYSHGNVPYGCVNGSAEKPIRVSFCETPVGSLQVTITPQGAVDAGAKWRVDEGVWQNSGVTVSGLSVGDHTVTYNTISGWDSPGDDTITINEGSTATTSGTYTLQTGSLQVAITPQGAVDDGAKWRVDDGAWQDSGATVNGLTVGGHTVSYHPVMGWSKPANESITIDNGQTTATTGVYVSEGPLTGNDRLTLGGSGNVGVGASYPEEKMVVSKGNFLQTAGSLRHMGAIIDDPIMELEGAKSIYISGKYAYVASLYDDGVEILDISVPSNPTHAGAIADDEMTELDGAYSIHVSGKYAYVASYYDDGVEILDISDPSNPTHVGAITDNSTRELDGACSIQVSGKYAYVTGYHDDGVEILDISNPSNPTHVGAITDDDTTELDGAHGVHVSGKYAYVASDDDDGVEILDISEPSNPTHVGAITDDGNTELGGAHGIYVVGKYAYVASFYDDGVEVLDISDPSNPTHVGAIDDDGTTVLDGAWSIWVSGKYAYVTSYNDKGVEILDISDPSNPTHAGAITDDGTTALDAATSIWVSGKYAYVTSCNDNGLEILGISGLDAPAASIGAVVTDSLDVSDHAQIGNNLSVGGGMNAGLGGIKSDGPLSAQGAVSIGGDLNAAGSAFFGDELSADSRVSMKDILKLTPRESPPDAPQNGCVYYDQTDPDAFCVYLEDAWVKIAGSGSCQ